MCLFQVYSRYEMLVFIVRCGICAQVVMLFPHAFWRKADMFGRIAPSRERRGEFFLFYSYATISGGAVLAALVAGDAAVEFEKTDPEESTRRVLATLTGIFHPKGIRVPAPLQVISRFPCLPFWLVSRDERQPLSESFKRDIGHICGIQL